jgi:hypothetical protein
MKYTIKHKLKQLGQEQNASFKQSSKKSKTIVETEIHFKNKWVVRMISEKISTEKNRLYRSENYLFVEYIETNSKLIKKEKLPFRKSKLKNTKRKDYEHIKEYNRYGIQLVLGNKEVLRIMKSLITFWKDENDFKPKSIRGIRLTGTAGNNNTSKKVCISL